MKRWMAGLMLACAGLACAAPVMAESRFSALRYTQDGVKIEPPAVTLTSANDRDWQLTVSNCVLDVIGDETKWSEDDIKFRKGYEKGFSGAANPNGFVLSWDGRAKVAGQVADTTGHPVKCDANRFYWVAFAQVPQLPGYAVAVVTATDDFTGTNLQQIGVLFQPDVFLEGQAKPASELGPVTAGIAKAIAK